MEFSGFKGKGLGFNTLNPKPWFRVYGLGVLGLGRTPVSFMGRFITTSRVDNAVKRCWAARVALLCFTLPYVIPSSTRIPHPSPPPSPPPQEKSCNSHAEFPFAMELYLGHNGKATSERTAETTIDDCHQGVASCCFFWCGAFQLSFFKCL